jgi:hypothetical protein
MKERIMRINMTYVMCIDHKRKQAIYANSMTELANHIISPVTNKLTNRKSIAKHLNKASTYASYQWISTNKLTYQSYKVIDSTSLKTKK